MKYAIAAHPTRYKDVLFRSRLEARWAAFDEGILAAHALDALAAQDRIWIATRARATRDA